MKLYFGVIEAARILGVKPHTLRYWETKVSTLRPQRRKSRRFYSIDDLKAALVLKHLIQGMGFSLQGASKKIEKEGVESLFPSSWEKFSVEIREELEEILKEVVEVKEFLKASPMRPFYPKKKKETK